MDLGSAMCGFCGSVIENSIYVDGERNFLSEI
jgi:hypothetical protein